MEFNFSFVFSQTVFQYNCREVVILVILFFDEFLFKSIKYILIFQKCITNSIFFTRDFLIL